MATVVVFKVITAPLLIVGLTLLIRRFGPAMGGLAMGVPLVTGPISVFTYIEQGPEFARAAAVGNLVGQVSTCLFCFAYSRSAARSGAGMSTALGVAAYGAATLIWRQFDWTLPAAALLLSVGIGMLILTMPEGARRVGVQTSPAWDLPLRMIVAAGFVLLLTSVTRLLGPQLSGLLAPFPVFVLILAVFTHLHRGGDEVAGMLRGVVVGSLAFGSFFVVVALGLGGSSPGLTYLLASAASIAASGAVYVLMQRRLLGSGR